MDADDKIQYKARPVARPFCVCLCVCVGGGGGGGGGGGVKLIKFWDVYDDPLDPG